MLLRRRPSKASKRCGSVHLPAIIERYDNDDDHDGGDGDDESSPLTEVASLSSPSSSSSSLLLSLPICGRGWTRPCVMQVCSSSNSSIDELGAYVLNIVRPSTRVLYVVISVSLSISYKEILCTRLISLSAVFGTTITFHLKGERGITRSNARRCPPKKEKKRNRTTCL